MQLRYYKYKVNIRRKEIADIGQKAVRDGEADFLSQI